MNELASQPLRDGAQAGVVGTAEAVGGEPPRWRQLIRTWGFFVAVVLLAAVVVGIAFPDWIGDSEHEIPNDPVLAADIFVNNLLLALLPLIGGWLAAGHLLVGRKPIAALLLMPPLVIVARSLITIGAVGGADPDWLLDSSRWWLLEVAALAVGARSGLWLARNPDLRERYGAQTMRRAVATIVVLLATGAVVEVLTA